MMSDEREGHLIQLMGQAHDENVPHELRPAVEFLKNRGERLDYADLSFVAKIWVPSVENQGNSIPPLHVCEFVSEVLGSREAIEVLAPMAGDLWFAAGVASGPSHCRIHAVSRSEEARWLVSQLNLPRIVLSENDVEFGPYDAIVCMPEYDRSREERPARTGRGKVVDHPNLLAILDMADRISENGLIAWGVPPDFVFDYRKTSVRGSLSSFGLHLTALLQGASTGYSPYRYPGVLALIERIDRGDLFVGELPTPWDASHEEMVERLRARQDSFGSPSQGRVLPEKEFFGLATLAAAERATALGANRGWDPIPGNQIIIEINSPKGRLGTSKNFPSHLHEAIYLPPSSDGPVVTCREELPAKIAGYLQVALNTDRANPVYVAAVLNTPLGRAIRDSACTGNVDPKLNDDRLLEVDFYLPAIDIQNEAADVLSALQLRRVELDELESELWGRADPRSIMGRVENASHEDQLKGWVASLPFPLASILRAYCVEEETSAKAGVDRLFFFFEAASVFFATIHLSALRGDRIVWQEMKEKLMGAVKGGHGLDLEKPSFGLWNLINGCCFKCVRLMLNNGDDDCRSAKSLYACTSQETLKMLSSRRLIGIFTEANERRNKWKGHTGDIGTTEAMERHDKMRELLERFRKEVGRRFDEYRLLLPGGMTRKPGPVYRCDTYQAMGSDPQFEYRRIELESGPVSGALCLHEPAHKTVLELIALVKIIDGPQSPCYFYNGSVEDGCRYVRYYPGGPSEHMEGDVSVEAIVDLNSKNK